MTFQMGDKVEILIWGGFSVSTELGMFVGEESEEEVIVNVKGKHIKVEKRCVSKLGVPSIPPYCNTCHIAGKWVNQGNVGKWWYCTTCKCEIESGDNVYGISARKQERGSTKIPSFKYLNCRENTYCKVCKGVASQYPDVDVRVGCEVECLVDTGTALVKGKRYPVLALTYEGIVIPVLNNKTGVFEEKNIRRCRLVLCVP